MTTLIHYTCPNSDCGYVSLEAEVVPAEHGWGADADGNRGIYIPAYIISPEVPDTCPTCGMVYDEDQQWEISEELKVRAERGDDDL